MKDSKFSIKYINLFTILNPILIFLKQSKMSFQNIYYLQIVILNQFLLIDFFLNNFNNKFKTSINILRYFLSGRKSPMKALV